VKAVIETANQVANIYINDTRNVLENYTLGVGMQIKGMMSDITISNNDIEEILKNETSGLGMDAIICQLDQNDGKIVIVKSPFTLSLQFEDFPSSVLLLEDGEVTSFETKNSIIAVEALSASTGTYLIVSKNIERKIVDHRDKINDAILEYAHLSSTKTGLKMTFIAFFSSVILLLLMIVILAGIIFANRIVRPVNKLIYAAKNISLGNYNSPITAPESKNELDILISSFNIMIDKLEEQKNELIISNRQNAWRDIARKIAHEIKNPLTPIQLAAERLRKKYNAEIRTDPEVFTTCIDTIIRQVNCIGTLVKEFSDFARMPDPKFEDTNIVSLIKEMMFLQSNSNKNIQFHIMYDGAESEYICYVDPFQMNQVFMNLLQNAINAINESSTSNAAEGNIYILIDNDKSSNEYHVTVEDDGPGFSHGALSHALDPYYTTRGAGSGLGLAIVYKIVIEHSGRVEIANSKKFGGASVTITIQKQITKHSPEQGASRA
jgi:two-component system nitrogen regulation sensor histidine kinase NtrY